MKILNLFCGIGGNRAYWPGRHDVTAVDESDLALRFYRDLYGADNIVQADAWMFLLDNFQDFDFIWASPPCKSHSRWRLCKKPEYADLRIYALITFLQTWFKGLYCVENVKPYYAQLIPAINRGRHLLWTNFYVPEFNTPSVQMDTASVEGLRSHLEYQVGDCKDRELLRNCCHPKIGKEVLRAAIQARSNPDGFVFQSDWLRSN